jgi:hypothetical protein
MSEAIIVTEVEAKTKWCPKSMTSYLFHSCGDIVLVGVNRQFAEGAAIIPAGCHCLGSACMWWVWWGEPRDNPRKGYCGPAR